MVVLLEGTIDFLFLQKGQFEKKSLGNPALNSL